jgi:DNA-binding PadR family transcriptional regulator
MANRESYLGEFEHIILLTIMRLKDEAYGIKIRQEIKILIGRDVSIGALYATIHRLDKKSYIIARSGSPTPERGGRAKRYFTLTTNGINTLKQTKNSLDILWSGLSLNNAAN